jgi:hypothetical protein
MLEERSTIIVAISLFSIMVILISVSTESINSLYISYGHLDHLPHYNGGESRYGSGIYYSYMALDPEYGIAKEPTKIEFSIQDFEARDVYDIATMVEIYDTSSGRRLDVFPWTFRNTGDFVISYTFPENGNYQIVLSVATEKSVNNDGTYAVPNGNNKQIDPPRSILGSIKDCKCERTVFNIKINPIFGNIQNSLFAAIIILPLAVLGAILAKNFSRAKFNRKELLKYGVMLLALAGGILHLAVFPQHASLHIYYSIFLLSAAGSQIAYGVLYVLTTLSDLKFEDAKTKQEAITLYKKNLAVNLFGLTGTAVLVGLYVYTVIFPPPLSPTNQPEEIGVEGIIAKSLEFLLFFGIFFIMKQERQQMRKTLMQLAKES